MIPITQRLDKTITSFPGKSTTEIHRMYPETNERYINKRRTMLKKLGLWKMNKEYYGKLVKLKRRCGRMHTAKTVKKAARKK